jgi:predicted transcriptional regulator
MGRNLSWSAALALYVAEVKRHWVKTLSAWLALAGALAGVYLFQLSHQCRNKESPDSGRSCTFSARGMTGYTSFMKVAISLPDDLFNQAEEEASRLHMKRSQLYARAIQEFLASQNADPVTKQLDELADEFGQAGGAEAGRRLIETGSWQW